MVHHHHLVVTRLHDRFVRRLRLSEGEVLNVSRSFVSAGRRELWDDRYVSRGVHVQLYVLRGKVWIFNAYANSIVVAPSGRVVEQGCRARVGGMSFCFGPLRRSPHNGKAVSVTQLHVEVEEDTDTPPPTPVPRPGKILY